MRARHTVMREGARIAALPAVGAIGRETAPRPRDNQRVHPTRLSRAHPQERWCREGRGTNRAYGRQPFLRERKMGTSGTRARRRRPGPSRRGAETAQPAVTPGPGFVETEPTRSRASTPADDRHRPPYPFQIARLRREVVHRGSSRGNRRRCRRHDSGERSLKRLHSPAEAIAFRGVIIEYGRQGDRTNASAVGVGPTNPVARTGVRGVRSVAVRQHDKRATERVARPMAAFAGRRMVHQAITF